MRKFVLAFGVLFLLVSLALAEINQYAPVTEPFEKPNEPCPRTFFLWSSGNFFEVDVVRDASGAATGADFNLVEPAGAGGTGSTGMNGSGFNNADGYIYAYSGPNFIRYDANGVCERVGRSANFKDEPAGFRGYYCADLSLDGDRWYFCDTSNPRTHLVWYDLDPTAAGEDIMVRDGNGEHCANSIRYVDTNGNPISISNMGDVAISPLDGKLYGVYNNGRIVQIDPLTGVVQITTNPAFPSGGAAGGVWFDTDGVLYAIRNGNAGRFQAVQINQANFLATDSNDQLFNVPSPSSGSNDGAGCFGSVLGAAKDMGRRDPNDFTAPWVLDIYFTVENLANGSTMNNLTMPDDLSEVFGVHGTDWCFTEIVPEPASGSTIDIWNPNYDGHTNTELIAANQSIAPGQVAQARVTIELKTLANLDADNEFKNAAVVCGEIGTVGYVLKDQSHDPTAGEPGFEEYPDPDPADGATPPDGNPTENEVSTIGLESLPVGLSSFRADLSGDTLSAEWSTSSETSNLGFFVYAKTGGKLLRLGEMVQSQVVDSTDSHRYHASFEVPETPTRVAIATVDTQGHQEMYGPFKVGRSYGEQANDKKIDWSRVKGYLKRKGYIYSEGKLQSLGDFYRSSQRALRVTQRLQSLFGPRFTGDVPYAKVQVEKPGFVFVSHEELLSLGLDLSGARKGQISVALNGEPVARHIYGPKNFGAGSGIAFYAASPDQVESLYSSSRVYTIQKNRNLRKSASVVRTEASGDLETSGRGRVVVEQNLRYTPTTDSYDPWTWDSLFALGGPVSRSYPAEFSGLLDSSEPVTLRAHLVGGTDFPSGGDDHHVQLSLNGQLVADATADGKKEFIIEGSVDPSLLSEQNQITVTVMGDTGHAFDLVSLNRFEFDFAQDLAAQDGVLEFEGDGDLFQLRNFDKRPLILGHSQGELRVIKPRKLGENWLAAGFSGEAQYCATETRQGLAETSLLAGRVAPSHLNEAADYLVITHPIFADEPKLQEFIASKVSQGYQTKLVSLDDIYEAHGYGNENPLAIQRFLARAAQHYNYSHVLLVGADSYDYHNYLSAETLSFVPSLYGHVRDGQELIASDGLMVDIDGDQVPDKAIGRWSVRTAEELANIVDKNLAYESGVRSSQRALLLAEQSPSGAYAQKLNSLLPLLKSSELWEDVTRVFVDTIITQNPELELEAQVELARQSLKQALQRGQAVTLFEGHGSTSRWSYDNLITSESAQELGNEGNPTVFLPLACYTTAHNSPTSDTLAHQLMHSGGHGGVAITGSSALSDSNQNHQMAEKILRMSLAKGSTLGEAVLTAKRELAQRGYRDVNLSWELLGDPTLRLEQ